MVRGQNAYLLGPLVELASDLDRYNTEMPGIIQLQKLCSFI
jgi:hypothetical protein